MSRETQAWSEAENKCRVDAVSFNEAVDSLHRWAFEKSYEALAAQNFSPEGSPQPKNNIVREKNNQRDKDGSFPAFDDGRARIRRRKKLWMFSHVRKHAHRENADFLRNRNAKGTGNHHRKQNSINHSGLIGILSEPLKYRFMDEMHLITVSAFFILADLHCSVLSSFYGQNRAYSYKSDRLFVECPFAKSGAEPKANRKPALVGRYLWQQRTSEMLTKSAN